MNPRFFARESAVIPLVAAASLAGKSGFFYKLDNANKAVAIAAVTDIPHGVILDVSANGLEISALPLGASGAPVKVKLGADVTDLRKNLTIRADGSVESDDAAGDRVVVARPLETGLDDEEIAAVLLPAHRTGAAVVLGSTNGTAAAAADLAALKAEAELIGDDVRAIHAALVQAGYLA
jgi:hypothetical protein